MAKIILHRKPAFSHRFRPFQVYIDGEKAGLIKNGGTEEFPVTPGLHKIHCRMSWYHSDVFNVMVGETDVKFLKVSAGPKFMGLIYALLIIGVLAPVFFRSASWYDPEVFGAIRLAVLAIVIGHGLYYNFIERKRYLKISEDTENIFNR